MRKTLTLALLLALPMTASAVPMKLNHQGYLSNANGNPLTGSHDLTFSLYDDAAATNAALWLETITVTFDDGAYSVELGATSTIDDTLLDQYPLYLGLSVDAGGDLLPRHEVVSAPYAIMAETAYNVDGGTVNATAVDATSVTVGNTVIDSNGISLNGTALPTISASDSSTWDAAAASVSAFTDLSAAQTITAAMITAWNTANSWGNHAGLYISKTGDTFSGLITWNGANGGDALDMVNSNILHANMVSFNDEGVGEGIIWEHSNTTDNWNMTLANTSYNGNGNNLWLAAAGAGEIYTNASINIPDAGTTLNMGSHTDQLINLYSDLYAIGVQSGTTYFRSDLEFAWFRDGVHSDSRTDPGAGGTVAMHLNSTGDLAVEGMVSSHCDTGFTEIGGWCIEDTGIKGPDTWGNAARDCDSRGLQLAPVYALALCDSVQPAGSDCHAATDGSEVLWTSDFQIDGTDVFSRHVVYNASGNTATGLSGALAFQWLCATPIYHK